jgi:hypothetical protein
MRLEKVILTQTITVLQSYRRAGPHSFKRKSLRFGLSVKNSAMNARRKEPTVKARMGPTAVRNAKSMMVSKWCRKLAST